MGLWVNRLQREWVLAVELIAATLFLVGDTAGWIEDVTGKDIPTAWLFIFVFIVFGATAMARLAVLHERLDERDRYKAILEEVEGLLVTGNKVLRDCGYPTEALQGYTSPQGHGAGYNTWFMEVANPQINGFGVDAREKLLAIAPDYLGTLENIGNPHDKVRPAMLNQLEGWLRQLEKIADDVRAQLKVAR